MALNPSPMEEAFHNLWFNYAETPRYAAQKLAQAYFTYAKDAQAGPCTPVFTGSEVGLLENTLYTAIMDWRSGSPIKFATAWGNGVFAFWMSPPVKFTGGPMLPATAVVQAPVQPIIIPGLMALYTRWNTARGCAQQQASILDQGTKLVMVQLVPPPPAPSSTVPVT